MKILQINKFYYQRGGSEKYLLELTKLFEKNGHIIVSFSMKDSHNCGIKYKNYFTEKVNLEKFSFKNILKIFYNFDVARKLEKLIKEEKPDIAHLHNFAYQLSPAIILTLKKHNIPIVQTLHDYKLICPNYRLFSKKKVCQKCNNGNYYNCLFHKCVKNSWSKSFLAMFEEYWSNSILKIHDKIDLFIAPSQFMKDMCVKFGISENKIKVVYNFVETKKAKLPIENLASCAENYILYFGRLSEEKGIDVLLSAMKKVDSDVKLKIVGVGSEYENYKLQITNYKLNNQVEPIGPKYGEELNNLIINAKAIIIPSIWPENMPLSMLESMALGKVVIASRIGGIPEVIKDRENGILFNSNDSDSLAEKINQLQKINVNNIGANAVITMKNFSPEGHYKDIVNIYNTIIKR